jgi:hypothetical protein
MASPAATESANKKPKDWLILSSVACLLVGLFVGHVVTHHFMRHTEAGFTTPYQAVLLSNGAVYYGKLSGYHTHSPELTDVFYIVSKTDPETKQVTNILVKRGKELHGPDRMYLNASQIVFVEPVGPSSKVAQLINEANR